MSTMKFLKILWLALWGSPDLPTYVRLQFVLITVSMISSLMGLAFAAWYHDAETCTRLQAYGNGGITLGMLLGIKYQQDSTKRWDERWNRLMRDVRETMGKLKDSME